MKKKDLQSKTREELHELLKKASEKITDGQFNYARSRSKNVKEMRELRRERARILTLLNQKV